MKACRKYGIEARDRPVVVVKDLGDCRIATKVHARLRRNAAGYWQVDGEFYNPITGVLDSTAYCSLLGRKRSRKAAVAAAKPFAAKVTGWNWWYCSVQYAREVARNKGVFMLRITKCKDKQ